jgi:hypothetical protein
MSGIDATFDSFPTTLFDFKKDDLSASAMKKPVRSSLF